MKATGIVRRIDELGRVVIPKEIRRTQRIRQGDPLEIFTMTMDARKQRVLQAIVALYGLEGEPVGSSVLANYFDMAVSSATLRNEMAALTKLGLLEQPHTSAQAVSPVPRATVIIWTTC